MAGDASGPTGPAERIRWNDEEQANSSRPRRSLSRRNSTDSMSIRRHSRVQVDPAAALPVQYRTVYAYPKTSTIKTNG